MKNIILKSQGNDNMKNIHNKINSIMKELREIRDNQTEIECSEDGAICNQFDLIIDELESLRDKFDFN